jgi:hypothetical protein
MMLIYLKVTTYYCEINNGFDNMLIGRDAYKISNKNEIQVPTYLKCFFFFMKINVCSEINYIRSVFYILYICI